MEKLDNNILVQVIFTRLKVMDADWQIAGHSKINYFSFARELSETLIGKARQAAG